MSKGPIIVGGLALGGAVVYALSQQEGVRAVAVKVAERIEDAARAVVKKVASMGIGDKVLANFQRYGIGPIITRHLGDIPWALAAATVELESAGDPFVYNLVSDHKKTARWVPGAPLPTDSYANGLFQILTKYTRPTTTKGYDIDFRDVFDAEKNAAAALKVLNTQWARAKQAPSDALRWALFYVGQNRGGGNAKSPGLLQALQHVDAGDVVSVVTKAGIPATVAAAAAYVAARVPLWLAVEAQLKGP